VFAFVEVVVTYDGVRIRFVLASIARTDSHDTLGRPVYQPFFLNLFVSTSPEELR
jgi:hypothetical protein